MGKIPNVNCKYDEQLNLFLGNIVQYTLRKYAFKLDISSLREVELINVGELPIQTDGRVIDDSKIILTSRLFDLLPNYEIERLYRNKNFKQIVCTLYHEMGHINDMKLYHKIYRAALESEDMKEVLPSFFWAEYLAEKRSTVIDLTASHFCESFLDITWNPISINESNATVDNFFYLNKVLSYFIARAENTDEKFFDEIKDEILYKYVCELRVEIKGLLFKMPFDDIDLLKGLYELMNKYYKQFVRRSRN